jgi:hypothetical protein
LTDAEVKKGIINGFRARGYLVEASQIFFVDAMRNEKNEMEKNVFENQTQALYHSIDN